MKILSWNVRGLGGSRSFRGLAHVFKTISPKMVFISETKMKLKEDTRVRDKLGISKGVTVETNGRRGGLACWWADDREVEECSSSFNHIDMVIIKSEKNLVWRFTGFYGFPEVHRRGLGCQLLVNLHNEFSLPWVVGGDFNEIMSATEKIGGRHRPFSQMEEFLSCQQTCGLLDLGYCGHQFTWRRVQAGEIDIEERLDRFLGNREWISIFEQYRVTHGIGSISDHCPIILNYTHLVGEGMEGGNSSLKNHGSWMTEFIMLFEVHGLHRPHQW